MVKILMGLAAAIVIAVGGFFGFQFYTQHRVAGEIDAYSREFRVRHKDGSYRWFESSFTSALDNPLIAGVVINSRDITERKLAEDHLAQREEVYRLAADAVNGVIYEWDIARGVVHRSRGVLEVLGLEPGELEPTTDAWCERVHPQDFETVKKIVSLGLLNGRGWTTTYRIRDVRGRYRSILERGLIQRNVGGDPVRAIGFCVDVSEIKRVTDLLAETQRAAKMGGWEYSYATRELTWTDEMYRIYEANPSELNLSWQSMQARCTPESLKRLRGACDSCTVRLLRGRAAQGCSIEICVVAVDAEMDDPACPPVRAARIARSGATSLAGSQSQKADVPFRVLRAPDSALRPRPR